MTSRWIVPVSTKASMRSGSSCSRAPEQHGRGHGGMRGARGTRRRGRCRRRGPCPAIAAGSRSEPAASSVTDSLYSARSWLRTRSPRQCSATSNSPGLCGGGGRGQMGKDPQPVAGLDPGQQADDRQPGPAGGRPPSRRRRGRPAPRRPGGPGRWTGRSAMRARVGRGNQPRALHGPHFDADRLRGVAGELAQVVGGEEIPAGVVPGGGRGRGRQQDGRRRQPQPAVPPQNPPGGRGPQGGQPPGGQRQRPERGRRRSRRHRRQHDHQRLVAGPAAARRARGRGSCRHGGHYGREGAFSQAAPGFPNAAGRVKWWG